MRGGRLATASPATPAALRTCGHWNHKMKREAVVPIDEEREQLIGRKQHAVRQRWPAGTPVLFPQPTANPSGRTPVSDATCRSALDRWLKRCDIRGKRGPRSR
jgi:hypothetical protein